MVLTFLHRAAGVQVAVPNGAIVLNTPIVLTGLQEIMGAPASGVVQANLAIVHGLGNQTMPSILCICTNVHS
jgi:hypothetical protein